MALDTFGNVACATSTGGIRNKMVGRVGDSPFIGELLDFKNKVFIFTDCIFTQCYLQLSVFYMVHCNYFKEIITFLLILALSWGLAN